MAGLSPAKTQIGSSLWGGLPTGGYTFHFQNQIVKKRGAIL